jgi:hypothetical protein
MHGVGCASLLRVGPVDAPIGVPLLGVEEVVVGLGLPSDEVERFGEVGAKREGAVMVASLLTSARAISWPELR